MAVNQNATCPYNHVQTVVVHTNRTSTSKDCFDCSDISAECLQKAADGDCLFYTCFDERHPCELNNWALSYGWRFCKRYDQMYDTFTQEASARSYGVTYIDWAYWRYPQICCSLHKVSSCQSAPRWSSTHFLLFIKRFKNSESGNSA